ncbi:hypothetical protein TRVA0_003S00760 [Trichomonascus vanleenenianus]|uniref:uncharacterized protein n=1 Tax=Trichomonascus vanleenenianus TaxID=2268995 RepID=UPI003ECA8E25
MNLPNKEKYSQTDSSNTSILTGEIQHSVPLKKAMSTPGVADSDVNRLPGKQATFNICPTATGAGSTPFSWTYTGRHSSNTCSPTIHQQKYLSSHTLLDQYAYIFLLHGLRKDSFIATASACMLLAYRMLNLGKSSMA